MPSGIVQYILNDALVPVLQILHKYVYIRMYVMQYTYYSLKISLDAILTKPNSGCEEECKPPSVGSQKFAATAFPGWPKWPQC